MRKINLLVIHCSASDKPDQDSVEAVRNLHVSSPSIPIKWGKYATHGKGWSDIGYHYFISKDGSIYPGRPEDVPGAHVRGHNARSIGVCLSGDTKFTDEQFRSLERICLELTQKHNLEKKDIVAHRDLDPKKACPNFDLHSVISRWGWH
jgi:N-acetylmuramoyl-L-alanine amidase